MGTEESETDSNSWQLASGKPWAPTPVDLSEKANLFLLLLEYLLLKFYTLTFTKD